jgi:hypothetical protein
VLVERLGLGGFDPPASAGGFQPLSFGVEAEYFRVNAEAWVAFALA